MNLVFEVRVRKKYAIYLPRSVVRALKLREGDSLLLRVSGRKIIIEPIVDPIELAISEAKFTCLRPKDIESISLREQEKYSKNTN